MNQKKNNILLLGAGFSTLNMGVWALASGAITAAWWAHPAATIHLFDYHDKPARYNVRYSGGSGVVRLLNIRFSKKFWMPNNIARLLLTALLIKLVPFEKLRNRLFSKNYWLRHILKADLVGSIAGGDSFSDIYGLRRLIYVALPQLLVLLVGQNLILLPQTIGPFKSLPARVLARYILKHATKIYSRDHEGMKQVYELIGANPRHLFFCYDMGFVLEPLIAQEKIPVWMTDLEPGTPLLGLNVSGLLYMGGYSRKNMFGLKGDYRKTIHSLIAHFIRYHKAHVVLIPHVLGDAYLGESDVTACRKIIEATDESLQRNLHLFSDGYDHHELKALIGRCDFLVGSRMHACIAALSQFVPAVALAYSRKFRGLYESIGMGGLVVDLRDGEEHMIVSNVDRIYQEALDHSYRLKEKMPIIKKTILSLFS